MSSNPRGTYVTASRTASGAGFGAIHTGHGAQPASTTINATQPMWIIYLEVALALALVAFIVWFTWPRKRK
jgi:hypothetical protein